MRTLILGLILLLAACSSDWQKAERSAKEFAEKLAAATGKVSCTHQDTDDDGYCSCTVFMQDGSTMAIDCGCERLCLFRCAEGCKVVERLKGKGFDSRTTNIKIK